MSGTDFCDVRLNAAGAAIAGADGAIAITTQHFSYTFTANASTRVLTSEWRKVLSVENIQGQRVLEIVPDAPVSDAQSVPPAEQTQTIQAAEATVEAQATTAQPTKKGSK